MDVFICGVCREEFHDVIKFMEHKKSNPDSYTCNLCHVFFHAEVEFVEHMKSHAEVVDNSDEINPLSTIAHVAVNNNSNITIIPTEVSTDPTLLDSIQIVYTNENLSTEEDQQILGDDLQAIETTNKSVILSVNTNENELDRQENLIDKEPVQLPNDGIYVCRLCSSFTFSQMDLCKHLLAAHEQDVDPNSENAGAFITRLTALESNETKDSSPLERSNPSSTMHLEVKQDEKKPGTLQLFVKPKVLILDPGSSGGTQKKKRGRPKKNVPTGEEQARAENREIGAESRSSKKESLPVPSMDPDGKIRCEKCKRSFGRERHFLGHRCWGSNAENGDYIDLSKKNFKDVVGDSELLNLDDHDDDEDLDTDQTADFRAYFPHSGLMRKRRRTWKHVTRTVMIHGADADTISADTQNEKENQEKNLVLTESDSHIDQQILTDSLNGEEIDPEEISKMNIPVFANDEQKRIFEEKLNSVDLSCVDDYFTKHVVEQNINDFGSKNANREKEDLDVYSCNVCKKVFKTLSHMRHHCLIHTRLKPFKCPVCHYSSNAKGNLYSHMRKHTGNYFHCLICDFKSCNRSHLIEHCATHTKDRHKCQLCAKDYNTLKSLMNHVRKYHNTQEGKEYLMTFMIKANKSAAILHQCHVCNRKFKKKLDRDRHLFVHNAQQAPYLLHCELCGYMASRRKYLENHYRKHRVVYICSVCSTRFLSSKQLIKHLQTHATETVSKRSEDEAQIPELDVTKELFETSVNMSWYLPEPDSALQLYKYVNLPEELITDIPDEIPATELDTANQTVVLQKKSGPVIGQGSLLQKKSGLSAAQPCLGKTGPIIGKISSVQPIDNASDPRKSQANILNSLNYKPMTMAILHKIRDTFGKEECEVCGRRFHNKCDAETHCRTHSAEKPQKCNRCDYTAVTKDNLKRHIETNHEKLTFACDQCDFIALSRTSLWHHQRKHKEVPTECPECKEKFDEVKDLLSHLIANHPDANPSGEAVTGFSPRIQGRLGRRSYKCPYCSRIFHRSNTDLQKHIWIHEGIKPFKCPICPHACRSRNNLNVHMLRHSSDKPHLCEECGKAYKSKTALRWHVRAHVDGQLYSCDKCDYTGSQKSHLKRHMETHDVIKRYVCQLCKYSSNTLAYMKVHYARKHKGKTFNESEASPVLSGDVKVYKCINCEYIFGNFSDLKRHLKARHHMNVAHLKEFDCLDGNAACETAAATPTRNDPSEDNYQTIHVETEEGIRIARISQQDFQELQLVSARGTEMEDGTSAVNIIQKIIEHGTFSQSLVSNDDDELVAINPESIIVQEGAQEVVVDGCEGDGPFVIQYLTPMAAGEETLIQEATEEQQSELELPHSI